MKKFIIEYILYVYTKHIKEEWDIYKKWIIPFIKPAWFVRSVLIWISSIIFFPFFYVGMVIDKTFSIKNIYTNIENIKKTKNIN